MVIIAPATSRTTMIQTQTITQRHHRPKTFNLLLTTSLKHPEMAESNRNRRSLNQTYQGDIQPQYAGDMSMLPHSYDTATPRNYDHDQPPPPSPQPNQPLPLPSSSPAVDAPIFQMFPFSEFYQPVSTSASAATDPHYLNTPTVGLLYQDPSARDHLSTHGSYEASYQNVGGYLRPLGKGHHICAHDSRSYSKPALQSTEDDNGICKSIANSNLSTDTRHGNGAYYYEDPRLMRDLGRYIFILSALKLSRNAHSPCRTLTETQKKSGSRRARTMSLVLPNTTQRTDSQ
jgi:hypothetical protein